MCGIVGILSNKENKSFVSKYIKVINKTLRHRGPDSKGIWANSDSSVALGHNRLSIQDLSKNGSQPMSSSDGKYIMVFNGEIYNHLELRNKIHHKWKGNSDTETLLELISKLGLKKTLKLISGMFAFGFWDKKKEELILVRDLYGEKPLYYGIVNNCFIFASELKAFLAIRPNNYKINNNGVLELLKRSYIPSPLTILDNVFKLPPGNFLKINKNFLNKSLKKNPLNFCKFQNFQTINWKKKINLKKKYQKPEIEIENLLEKSVKEQLISDVPVGCFLSGGVDSSIISFFAKKHSQKQLKTFSISVEDSEYNESVFSKIVSKKIKSNHFSKKFSSKDMLKMVKQIAKVYSEPFADSSQLPTMLLSKFARKHAKVVLSGDGADEFFGGYNRYYKLNSLWKFSCFFPRAIVKIFFKLIYKIPNYVNEKIYKFFNYFYFLNKNIVQPLTKYQKVSYAFSKSDNLKQFFDNVTKENWIDKKILHEKMCKANLIDFERYFNKINKNENKINIQDIIFLDQSVSLSDDMLCKVDRASMSVGLETRIPFLNKNLTYYLNNIPKKFHYLKTNKYILKKLLDKKIYSGFSKRPKMGFSIPLDKWLRTELKEFMLKILSKKEIEKHKILKWKVVNNKIKEHLQNKKNNERFLWSAIVLNLWLKNNKININV